MIEFTSGDILKCEAEALVNTVNCVGVMGRGIALQFRHAFPENFKAYAAACQQGEVHPGRLFIHETGRLTSPRYIVNFPTKRHWRGKSRIEDIQAGLLVLVEEICVRGIRSIAIPPLGSGLGGLDWADVRLLVEGALQGLSDVRVTVFEPTGAPLSERMVHSREVPAMTAGRAALVALMHRYLGGLLDPFVTLLEVHKLMYFMQEADEPLRLSYAKALYGPYAENLRHVLRTIEGHLVAGYADGGDGPGKPLTLVPGAMEDANRFLSQHPSTRARLDRVAALVEGFESSAGLELLSTVHWAVKHDGVMGLDEVTKQVHAWHPRKSRFTRRQVGIALDALTGHGWLAGKDAQGAA